jgi:hypothetical protein
MVTKKEVKYVASFLVYMFRNDVVDAWMTRKVFNGDAIPFFNKKSLKFHPDHGS